MILIILIYKQFLLISVLNFISINLFLIHHIKLKNSQFYIWISCLSYTRFITYSKK
jgi:hypothetical protein